MKRSGNFFDKFFISRRWDWTLEPVVTYLYIFVYIYTILYCTWVLFRSTLKYISVSDYCPTRSVRMRIISRERERDRERADNMKDEEKEKSTSKSRMTTDVRLYRDWCRGGCRFCQVVSEVVTAPPPFELQYYSSVYIILLWLYNIIILLRTLYSSRRRYQLCFLSYLGRLSNCKFVFHSAVYINSIDTFCRFVQTFFFWWLSHSSREITVAFFYGKVDGNIKKK